MELFRGKPRKPVFIDPLEPIPTGEAQESDWGAWDDLIASQDSPATMTEESKSKDFNEYQDPFRSVTKNSG